MPLLSKQDEPFEYDLYGVAFVMADNDRRVICRATKEALDDRAATCGRFMSAVQAFERYRSEIEAVASAQYGRGVALPTIASEDLVPIRIGAVRSRNAVHSPSRGL